MLEFLLLNSCFRKVILFALNPDCFIIIIIHRNFSLFQYWIRLNVFIGLINSSFYTYHLWEKDKNNDQCMQRRWTNDAYAGTQQPDTFRFDTKLVAGATAPEKFPRLRQNCLQQERAENTNSRQSDHINRENICIEFWDESKRPNIANLSRVLSLLQWQGSNAKCTDKI